jgi:hypothetical protein
MLEDFKEMPYALLVMPFAYYNRKILLGIIGFSGNPLAIIYAL